MSTKELSSGQVRAFASVLSVQEQLRADRFRRDEDRRTYVAAHALLRVMLAKTLGRPVVDFHFDIGAQGKPFLRNSGIEFNLSHTSGLALVGLCRGRRVGVDVEWLGRKVPLDIAPKVLTTSEYAWLDAQKLERQPQGFLRFWTVKEAIMKATGMGLTLAPNSFEVEISPLAIATHSLSRDWQVHDVQALPGYTAAVAVEGLATATVEVAEATFEWTGINRV